MAACCCTWHVRKPAGHRPEYAARQARSPRPRIRRPGAGGCANRGASAGPWQPGASRTCYRAARESSRFDDALDGAPATPGQAAVAITGGCSSWTGTTSSGWATSTPPTSIASANPPATPIGTLGLALRASCRSDPPDPGAAIEAGGSTLRDFVHSRMARAISSTATKSMTAGQPCPQCGRTIRDDGSALHLLPSGLPTSLKRAPSVGAGDLRGGSRRVDSQRSKMPLCCSSGHARRELVDLQFTHPRIRETYRMNLIDSFSGLQPVARLLRGGRRTPGENWLQSNRSGDAQGEMRLQYAQSPARRPTTVARGRAPRAASRSSSTPSLRPRRPHSAPSAGCTTMCPTEFQWSPRRHAWHRAAADRFQGHLREP